MREISVRDHHDHDDRPPSYVWDPTEDPLNLLSPEARQRVNQAWSDALVSVDCEINYIREHYGDDQENWHYSAIESLSSVKIKAAVTALSAIRREFQVIAEPLEEGPGPIDEIAPLTKYDVQAALDDCIAKFLCGLAARGETGCFTPR